MQYDLSAHEVPDWARCEGKLSGYRLGGTYADCLASLLRCHNSTTDAWTMIVASCISTALALYMLHKRANPVPVVAVWLSALIHMPWSVGYHTFAPMSTDVCTRWMKLDIAFIFVSGALLAFGLAYNVLPPWGVAVNTLVAVAVAAFAIHAIRRAKTKASDNKVKTATFIGSIVLAYIFPMLYYVTRGGRGLPVACAITALLALAVGAFVYCTGYPEAALPGAFDFVGSSHNILHVCVTVAHIAELLFVFGTAQTAQTHRTKINLTTRQWFSS